MSTIICPICKDEVFAPRDRLTMQYYQPHDWFTLRHERDGKPWCGIAGFKIDGAVFRRTSSVEMIEVSTKDVELIAPAADDTPLDHVAAAIGPIF